MHARKALSTAGRWRQPVCVLLLALLALPASRALAAEDPLPRPPALERDVHFWVRVYTEVTTDGGYLHDERDLGVVYETLRFDPEATPAQRREIVDGLRDHYRAVLRRLAEGIPDPTDEERRVAALFGPGASPERYTQAAAGIRFQLGQANRFREGLERIRLDVRVQSL